jgi:misacylated tRNA(Ala) deacylase
MGKEPLYLRDCYLKSWKTGVKSAKGKFIVLEETGFYPKSGGQPWDTGTMKRVSDGKVFKVVYAGKFSGEISHEVDQEGLKPGDEVGCQIDWERRYLFMRYHTAAHVLSKIIYNETGAVISGNQIGEDRTRIDFDLDEFEKESIQGYVDKANEMIRAGREVRTEFLPYEEAIKIPDFVRTRGDLLQKIKILRVINIVGFDKQACGGTHLRNISEIGRIKLLKTENKGKNNRRVYFSIG